MLCFGAAACAALGGCGAGTVRISELNFNRIRGRGPLTVRASLEQSAWWMEEEHLYLGLGFNHGGTVDSVGRKRFDLSLVLPGVPAGRARDYRLDARALRCYLREGAKHARFRSIRGIIGLWREAGGVLRGRFRLVAGKETFHVLTGWSPAGQVYMEGEFRARRDRALAMQILVRSEEDGMDRSVRPNTPADTRGRPVRVTGPPVTDPGS